MFISFFYWSNWPLFRPEAALKPDPSAAENLELTWPDGRADHLWPTTTGSSTGQRDQDFAFD